MKRCERNMIYALDIETKSKTDNPDHALIPHLSEITMIGAWRSPIDFIYWTNIYSFGHFLHDNPKAKFVGHNFKFDLKHLIYHGVDIEIDRWVGDTRLMASVYTNKITRGWLMMYETKRREENKKLKKGFSHREAKQHSLKTLAPYFLEVDPFWENPEDHANAEYCLKDCEYTYRLYEFFEQKLKAEKTFDFYEKKLLPWTKTLLRAELRGVKIDLDLMDKLEQAKKKEAKELKKKLDTVWKKAHKVFRDSQVAKIKSKYTMMLRSYLDKHPKVDREATIQRYRTMVEKKVTKLPQKINYGSSSQLQWLLRDYFKLDITNFNDKESSGREVLNRLAEGGREDLKAFLQYRKVQKLLTSFFPTYRELNLAGTLHGTFDSTGTRTGRLSSSGPNLQQVAGELHQIFISRAGTKFITLDMSQIEPRLVAYYTEDKNLCKMMISGGDFHSRNAIIMFGLDCEEKEVKKLYPKERHLAKTCGLALLYGARMRRIQQTALQQGWKWSFNKCEKIYGRFRKYYKEAFNWKDKFDKSVEKDGAINLLGRRFRYADPKDIYMKGFNRLIQSSASDLVVQSACKMEAIFNKQHTYAFPLLFVHDENVIEVGEGSVHQVNCIARECMTNYRLPTKHGNIPLEVEGSIENYWKK